MNKGETLLLLLESVILSKEEKLILPVNGVDWRRGE
jgi:hypothetical protein